MAGPQGLTPYQTTPGTDEWAANLRAGQSAAAQGGGYVLDPSLAAARDAARLGIANANGVGQTIGATAAGVGKIVGAAGNLASDYGSAVVGAIKGFGRDVATGFNGTPAAPAQTGGASGDWEGAAPVAAPSNAVAKASTGATNFAPPTIDRGTGVYAPAVQHAISGHQAATGTSQASTAPEYTPVSVIRGSRLGQEYTIEDQEKMAAAGMAPGRAGGYGPRGASGFGLTNPQSTIEQAFDRQQAINNGIFAQAAALGTSGDIFQNKQLAALAAHLGASMINNNNQGQVQGQGVNTMNQVAGGIQSAGIGAGAQMYGANAALTGHLATVGEQRYEAGTSSVPTGTALGTDPTTGMAVPLTTYGQRPATAGAMPAPYQQAKPQFVPGKEYTSNGKRAVYQADGTFKPVN